MFINQVLMEVNDFIVSHMQHDGNEVNDALVSN